MRTHEAHWVIPAKAYKIPGRKCSKEAKVKLKLKRRRPKDAVYKLSTCGLVVTPTQLKAKCVQVLSAKVPVLA